MVIKKVHEPDEKIHPIQWTEQSQLVCWWVLVSVFAEAARVMSIPRQIRTNFS